MALRLGTGFEWGAMTNMSTNTIAPIAANLGGVGQTNAGRTQGTTKKTGALALEIAYPAGLKSGTATASDATTMTDAGGGFNAVVTDGVTTVQMGGSIATVNSHTDTVLTITSWAPTGPTTGAYVLADARYRAKGNVGYAAGKVAAVRKWDSSANFQTACFIAHLYVPSAVDNAGAGGSISIFSFAAGAGVIRKLAWYKNGGNITLRVTTGTTVQGTSPALTAGTWISVKWLTATGAGITPQQDTLWIDNLRPGAYAFQGAGSSSVSDRNPILGDDTIIGGNCTYYVDNLSILDEDEFEDGTIMWAGPGKTNWAYGRFPVQVPVYYPFVPKTGTPTYNQWNKSTGTTAWDLIDETDAQTTTDYIEVPASTVIDQKQSWLMQTVSDVGVPAGLRPVCVLGRWYMKEPTVGVFWDAFLIIGAAEYQGSGWTSISLSYTWFQTNCIWGHYMGADANFLTRTLLDSAWEVKFYTARATGAGETIDLSRFMAEVAFVDPTLEDLAWGS